MNILGYLPRRCSVTDKKYVHYHLIGYDDSFPQYFASKTKNTEARPTWVVYLHYFKKYIYTHGVCVCVCERQI